MKENYKIGKTQDGREMYNSVGVLVECQGKYLLMDRVNPPFGFAGPAGHVDEGEGFEEAGKRELWEETGIVAENLELLYKEEIDPKNIAQCHGAVHLWHLYRASVDSFEIEMEKGEAKSMKWFSEEEIKNLKLEEVWAHWFEKLGIV